MPSLVRLILLAAALALVAPAAASAAEPLQWDVSPTSDSSVKAATPYSLANHTGGALGYGDRTFGVDLAWGGAGQWTFYKGNQRDRRSIRTSENVALYNSAAKAYLVQGTQREGIGLAWKKSPSYEWRVTRREDGVSLYSTRARSYLVYMKRKTGIPLGWQAGIAPGANVIG